MSPIALLSRRSLRAATCIGAMLAVAGFAPVGARTPKAQPPAAPITQPGAVIQHIVVEGAQRVEPATVLSYISIRQGDRYDEQAVDRSLKGLFATGLFADVKFGWDGSTLTIHVVENPIINQVVFEGADKVSEKDLTKEVQLKPLMVFTRAKVQADVQRIIELYRRNGKFAATVTPEIIQRPQNRVDLIFSINEGATTGVARIYFIGNHVFPDSVLTEQIATEESAWYKFLATNDNYDPDRLTYDREQLRRYYVDHGYADFNVVSAVAQLTPDRSAFYITFTLDEGQKYHFGKVEIDSGIKELKPVALLPLLPIHSGDLYDAELVQKSIDALTNAAGTRGYAFAQVHPRIRRDRDHHTIDVILKIDQGQRVYVEKVNITGNTRTLDKVIRRQMRLSEGDAFNRTLMDRSRTRIRALGFFKDVDIKPEAGSAPDKTVLDVKVKEQSTGELSLGAGYSSTESFVGEFSYTERNLFGRGQYLRGSVALSTIQKQFELSFTEPYFMDRPLAAGIDLFKTITDFEQASYEGDTTGISFRFGFPVSEFGNVQLHYTFRIDSITPFLGAPSYLQCTGGSLQSGLNTLCNTTTSEIGYVYNYSTLDDPLRPNTGFNFALSQAFAGFGGSLKYIRNEATFGVYHPLFGGDWNLSFTGSAGYIAGYDNQDVQINQRFFKGGDSFRGFQLAGIGPRDLSVQENEGALGGDIYAIGTISLRMPNFLPQDYGISTSLFSDFGTLGDIKDLGPRPAGCTANLAPGMGPAGCVVDNLGLRASAGISIGWKSPFGPLQIDLGIPFIKQRYDRTEIIHFSAGTGISQ